MTSDVSTTKVIEAIRQLVIFTLDTEKYATPISEVREVVKGAEVTPVPGSPPFIVGVVNLRGKIIPVLDLEKLFDLQRETAYPSAPLLLIVEHTDGTLFGVHVDHVAKIIKVAEGAIQPAPSMITARITADYVEGVIVGESAAANAGRAAEDVILLLSLQHIITKEVVDAVAKAADNGEAPADPVTPIKTQEESQS
jgi:purine-binding chemotaxis protein CheW